MNTNSTSFNHIIKELRSLMNPCTLCPRNCRVDRTKGETGFCGIADIPIVSSIGAHFGEEPVLVGSGGSGTIFFAGCNLACVYCQNYDISHLRKGREMTIEQLAAAMLKLQQHGCSNINFVTPTHVISPIVTALELARKQGLLLPIVYNTGGYDSVDTLKLLDGFIDIYMPDMKYADPQIAKLLSNAPDYPQVNQASIKEMHRQVGDLKVENGLAARGLLVQHLILPDNLAGSTETIDFLVNQISPATTINIMAQYRPCYQAPLHPQINRLPHPEEILEARDYARTKGLNLMN